MRRLVPLLVTAGAVLWLAAGAMRPAPLPGGFDIAELGRLPVVAGGRVQPFDSVGRNSLLQIRSTASLPPSDDAPSGREATELGATEWLLELMTRPDQADRRRVFLVHNPELLGELELSGQDGSGLRYWTFSELEPRLDEIEREKGRVDHIPSGERSAAERQVVKLFNALLVYQHLKNSLQPNSVIQREAAGREFSFDLAAALGRLEGQLEAGAAAFAAMQAGQDFDRTAMAPVLRFLAPFELVQQVALPRLVPPADPRADRDGWEDVGSSLLGSLQTRRLHPAVLHWATIATAYQQGNPADFNAAVASYRGWLAERGLEAELRKGRREHAFNRFQPFLKATVLYLVAFLTTCAFWLSRSPALRRAAAMLTGLTLALHGGGLVVRMVLEGRPPVTNLYSSAVFVGWGAVVLGLVVERFLRNGIGMATASFVGAVTQIIAHNLALGGDTMQMMQAVLDNNFWLATHVVVITLGYSSVLVAGFMAAGYILAGVATPWLSAATARSLERMVYGIVCFATLFSFVGTMLGGIWADQSWGRFWGWDPKENGALMIVLWAAIYLHVRWGRLARAPALMAIAVGGNVVTAFSWFGVNMLGVGLHSYGFMDTAFRWLLAFVASQAVVAGLGLLPQRLWRSFRSGSRASAAAPADAAQPGEGRRAGRPVRAPARAPAVAAARRPRAGRRRAARR